MTTKIALVSKMSQDEQNTLSNQFDINLEYYNDRRDDLAKEGADIEIVYGNVRPFELPSLPNLKWIQATWAGIENLCYPEMIDRNLIVTNIRGAAADAMTEHVISGLLYFLRDLPGHDLANQKSQWKRSLSISLLKNTTILLLGTGGIGLRLIELLNAFGCHVIGVNSDGHAVSGCESCIPLEKALNQLQNVDHIICTLPFTPQTNNLIGKEWFDAMNQHTVFVNISRGKIVNESNLIDAINNKTIRGAFLDVTAQEPLPEDSPLWKCENIFITGHRSYSPGNPQINPPFEAFKTNLEFYLKDNHEKMIHVIDFKKGY
ncbi:MAG: hypothetical protein COA79_14230 [Planctomycetota bacterium]|nr:MAG: hypothetical protein COA79_14230 [Planctomycetota bacterium]